LKDYKKILNSEYLFIPINPNKNHWAFIIIKLDLLDQPLSSLWKTIYPIKDSLIPKGKRLNKWKKENMKRMNLVKLFICLTLKFFKKEEGNIDYCNLIFILLISN